MAKQPVIPIQAAPLRLTMLMKTPTKVLSEEHWYPGTTSINATDPLANAAANALAVARIATLPTDCKMLEWTLSQENVYRDSYGNTQILPTSNSVGAPENLGNDVISIFMQSTPAYRRTMYYGCVPDNVINNDLFVPGTNAAWQTAWQNYMLLLTGQATPLSVVSTTPLQATWGFLPNSTDPSISVRVTIQNIVYIAGSDTITVITNANSLAYKGAVVRISNVQNVSAAYPMNQLWQVLSVGGGGTILTLNNFAPQALQPVAPLTGGYLQVKVRIWSPYSAYIPITIGTRRRGSRTGQPLGRRKRKYNIGFPG